MNQKAKITSDKASSMPHLQEQPISGVQWVHRDTLHANHYNPNHVAPPELTLLKQSILEDGWTQPIVVRTDGEIVDGFHRWTVSGHPELYREFEGMVPVVVLSESKTLADQMLATIRHNRARGVHGVMPMASIVRELAGTHGMSFDEIQERAGMEFEEVDRLHDQAGMPERVSRSSGGFGKAWTPTRCRGDRTS